MNSRVQILSRLLGASVLLGLFGMPAAQACTGVPPYGECTLQGKLNDYLGAGVAPNVATDAVPDSLDDTWSFNSTVGLASIVMEVAGFAPLNTFGIYDITDKTKTLEVFGGPDSDSALNLRALLIAPTTASLLGPYSFSVVGKTAATFASQYFGFYITTPQAGGQTYYSGANSDGKDYMWAFQGDSPPSTFIAGPLAGQPFTSTDFLLAWEDLKGGGDKDYQDLVVLARDVNYLVPTVPLPPAAWLLLSGLGGLFLVSRRRSKWQTQALAS